MIESTTITVHSSPCASLAAIGAQPQHLDLFAPIRQTVQIDQKTVNYTPTDKLYDAFITILADAHGIVEVNTRLRADLALQRAFGRHACARSTGAARGSGASDRGAGHNHYAPAARR